MINWTKYLKFWKRYRAFKGFYALMGRYVVLTMIHLSDLEFQMVDVWLWVLVHQLVHQYNGGDLRSTNLMIITIFIPTMMQLSLFLKSISSSMVLGFLPIITKKIWSTCLSIYLMKTLRIQWMILLLRRLMLTKNQKLKLISFYSLMETLSRSK